MANVRWVRVKSEDELRVGMCVELRPCALCDRNERLVILGEESHGRLAIGADGSTKMARSWRAAGLCEVGLSTQYTALSDATREGRLYRLQDDDEADDYATSETTRKERA